MSQFSIIPVILSGGSGTRLWPLSRNSKPKQFLSFGSGHTMIEDTMLRCQGPAFDPRPIFVAAEAHRFMVAEAARHCGVAADIVLEPMRRDSCAAVVAGALQAARRNPDALVLVVAADHHIPDAAAFRAAVQEAAADAAAGWIVTFGIRPTSPATGYGYILPGEPTGAGPSSAVKAFVEKPSLEKAKAYLENGYLWNSGNFLFKASSFLAEAARLAPEVHGPVAASLEAAQHDLDFLRLDKEAFAAARQISVDFAIMEKTSRAAVHAVDYGWNDIGSWDAVAQVVAPDAGGNMIVGRGVVKDGHGVIIHAEDRFAAVLGCDDIIVVTTRDAVMVARRGKAEKVKDLVASLQAAGVAEATETLRRYRPWGHHEILDDGEGYEIRRVVIEPGAAISRQSHNKRAEHWIVVKGLVEARIADLTFMLGENESATIPQGSLHEVRNKGSEPALLVEVHTGAVLEEADVSRAP